MTLIIIMASSVPSMVMSRAMQPQHKPAATFDFADNAPDPRPRLERVQVAGTKQAVLSQLSAAIPRRFADVAAALVPYLGEIVEDYTARTRFSELEVSVSQGFAHQEIPHYAERSAVNNAALTVDPLAEQHMRASDAQFFANGRDLASHQSALVRGPQGVLVIIKGAHQFNPQEEIQRQLQRIAYLTSLQKVLSLTASSAQDSQVLGHSIGQMAQRIIPLSNALKEVGRILANGQKDPAQLDSKALAASLASLHEAVKNIPANASPDIARMVQSIRSEVAELQKSPLVRAALTNITKLETASPRQNFAARNTVQNRVAATPSATVMPLAAMTPAQQRAAITTTFSKRPATVAATVAGAAFSRMEAVRSISAPVASVTASVSGVATSVLVATGTPTPVEVVTPPAAIVVPLQPTEVQQQPQQQQLQQPVQTTPVQQVIVQQPPVVEQTVMVTPAANQPANVQTTVVEQKTVQAPMAQSVEQPVIQTVQQPTTPVNVITPVTFTATETPIIPARIQPARFDAAQPISPAAAYAELRSFMIPPAVITRETNFVQPAGERIAPPGRYAEMKAPPPETPQKAAPAATRADVAAKSDKPADALLRSTDAVIVNRLPAEKAEEVKKQAAANLKGMCEDCDGTKCPICLQKQAQVKSDIEAIMTARLSPAPHAGPR